MKRTWIIGFLAVLLVILGGLYMLLDVSDYQPPRPEVVRAPAPRDTAAAKPKAGSDAGIRDSADQASQVVSARVKKSAGAYQAPIPGTHEPSEEELTELQAYFKDGVVNRHTVDVLKMLQTRFGNTGEDMAAHLKMVGDYLRSQLDSEKADELLDLYQKLVDYEMNLPYERDLWDEMQLGDADQAMAFLEKVQAHRREIFGAEVADALWDHELKSYEYTMRRHEIIQDEYLTGAEKEAQIEGLQQRIWGDEVNEEDVRKSPYALYQEKLKIYKTDLEHMTAQERLEKMKEFRHEILPEDAAARLDALEEKRLAGEEVNIDEIISESAGDSGDGGASN